ncbi:TetR/AcrR family transcriptional regulator [Streptomyces sp. Ru73]|uniref:TetR/AcrR family transcriptional regulator n=1 Tax=Streptomyces sp. Ru73 TaxID=2080748 RepID=UPI000CDDC941|nr:TetR/AcrR family transcriptional regulator [Streptomyces sp. Ru73]POX40669.1 TetR/AcrR family transcriptional regulator [Streptomyces sp. Ru73]
MERGERILEAAGELLVAWGYRRVTIDEIARRAGVGKGTVYLHWKTKDALFLAVVLRSKLRSHHAQLARMRAEPLDVLPSRLMSGAYQDFLKDPVLRALYHDDTDVLGRFTDIAKKELAELSAYSDEVVRRYLEVLRAHGLVRTDMTVEQQQYALLATASGFFLSEALLHDRAPQSAAERSRILARTVRGALETSAAGPGPDDGPATARTREAAAAAAAQVIPLYERLAELSEREMGRQLRQ